MVNKPRTPGFTLLELLIVVAIIALLAAVSVPLIFNWMNRLRLDAAAGEVAGEMQAARLQSIMKNANAGVAFMMVDGNSYRYVNVDLALNGNLAVQAQSLGPLRDLPPGVIFDGTGLPGPASTGVRFSRLGAACGLGSAGCPAFAMPACPEVVRCNDELSSPDLNLHLDPVRPGVTQLRLRDTRRGIVRTMDIQPGGQVTDLD